MCATTASARAPRAEPTGRRRAAQPRSIGGRPHASSLCGLFALLQLVEGQVGDDTLTALAVEDDLIRAAEHALHGLKIHALARHVRRLLVFVVDLEEARRLP